MMFILGRRCLVTENLFVIIRFIQFIARDVYEKEPSVSVSKK